GSEASKDSSRNAKASVDEAIELYAASLPALEAKYVGEGREGVKPDLAEVHLKIASLYERKGSIASAKDSCRRALAAYGVEHAKGSEAREESSRDVHPDACLAWRDLAALHLSSNECDDAARAAERSAELASRALRRGASGRVDGVPRTAFQIAGDAYAATERHGDASRSYGEAHREFRRLAAANRGAPKGGFGDGGPGLGPAEEAELLRKWGRSLSREGRLKGAKDVLTDALRILRSGGGKGEGTTTSPDLFPRVLSDLGRVYTLCGERAEATNALTLCLEAYRERGISDHSREVEEARELLDEARRGGGVVKPKLAGEGLGLVGYARAAAAGTPSTASMTMTASSASRTMAGSPQSATTALTLPSTLFTRSSTGTAAALSMGSGRGQLQTLLEELADPSVKSALSPPFSVTKPSPLADRSPAQQAAMQQHLAYDLQFEATAVERARLEESLSYEVRRLQARLEDAEREAERSRVRAKEAEAERDLEKKERVLAAAAHRKEVEALARSDADAAVAEAEMASLREEVEVSEASYRELVRAVDDEKERIQDAHETTVREMQAEVDELRDRLKDGGAIESDRLKDELEAKKRELEVLREQASKSSREVASLKSANLALRSEKDAATRDASALKSKNEQLQVELQRLSSELAAAKIQSANSVSNARSMELKKLQFELQSERSRRMILESSLQKEYDRGSGGGFSYPMTPFGYPPVHMGSTDNVDRAKLKTLEIDLATERASKEMLEKMVKEMRSMHDQEKESAQSQFSSFVASQEQEMLELTAEVEAKRVELDRVSYELVAANSSNEELSGQLNDTINELSCLKEQLVQTSRELSTATEDKSNMSDTISSLKRVEDDFSKAKVELRREKENARRKTAESELLSEENRQLKKEYNEAITLFESEIDRAKADKEESQATLSREVERLQDEVDTSKAHLGNVLGELEVSHQRLSELEMDLDNAREDFRVKEEQLGRARQEATELGNNYEELEVSLSELEDMIAAEKKARDDNEQMLEETQSKLNSAEETIEKLTKDVGRKEEIEERCRILDEVLMKCSVQLVDMLPKGDSLELTADEPAGLQALQWRMSHLTKRLKDTNATKNSALEKIEWNWSNALRDVETLESKNKQLKESFAKMENVQVEYDDLRDLYDRVVEEKEHLEHEGDERINEAEESLLAAQNERNLFETQLKEAMDDIETLECERDELQGKLDHAEVRIHALETDNKLIEKFEGQQLEYDAAVSEKDEKLAKFELELEAAWTKMDDVQLENAEAIAALRDKDEELKKIIAEMENSSNQRCSARDGIEDMEIGHMSPIERECNIYPDLLGSGAEISPVTPYEHQNEHMFAEEADNTFDGDSPEVEARLTTNPFDEDLLEAKPGAGDYEKEAAELKARVSELESLNGDLERKLNLEQSAPHVCSSAITLSPTRSEGDSDYIELKRERDELVEEIADLKNYIRALEESNEGLGAQVDETATAHAKDRNTILSLQEEVESQNEDLFRCKERVKDLQRSNEELEEERTCNQSSPSTEHVTDTEPLLREISALKKQLDVLQGRNAKLSAQLQESTAGEGGEQVVLTEEIQSLNDQLQLLKDQNKELSSRLDETEARATDASQEYEANIQLKCESIDSLRQTHQKDLAAILSLQNDLNDKEKTWQDKLNQELFDKDKSWQHLHDNDQATILALKSALQDKDRALDEHECLLQEKLQQARLDQDKIHRSALNEVEEALENGQATIASLQNSLNEKEIQHDKLEEKIRQLHSSEPSLFNSDPRNHVECNNKISALQKELESAMNYHSEKQIKHDLEVATVNAEFHNAMNSLDELQKENVRLKENIESLSSFEHQKSNDESKNFEKEMNAAHSRFVSMEKALQERVARLERDKEKLVADFNDEMIHKEDEHTKTKIELSAWKLEMQNALNDIEALKRERDELKAQVESYATSLEAACVEKAQLEERMHSLGMKSC
ncbi:hypothetical protein ACHAWF_016073, partial [Thalassiosira exigua]